MPESSERIEPGAEAAHRDDLARDVARLWATHPYPLTAFGRAGDKLGPALDRLADAYRTEE